jgi:hypothetical protein
MIFTLWAGSVNAGSRWETLEAIHWVENPKDRRTPGTYGELGAYQFRPDTWKMHSRRPFREALDRSRSDEVAVMHYEWIKAALERNGVEVTTYNIALAWNAGIKGALSGRAPRASHDYALRVNNLAGQLQNTVASNQ